MHVVLEWSPAVLWGDAVEYAAYVLTHFADRDVDGYGTELGGFGDVRQYLLGVQKPRQKSVEAKITGRNDTRQKR